MKTNFWMVSGLIALLAGSSAAAQSVPAASPVVRPAPIAPNIPHPPKSDYSASRALLVSLYKQGTLTDEQVAKAEDKLLTTTVFTTRELDQRPVPTSMVRPQWTNLPRFNGTVEMVFEFIVAPDGSVRHIRELAGAPAALALPWIQALSAWHYTPGVKDGRTVATVLQRRSRFSMSYSSSSSSPPNFSTNDFGNFR